MFAPWGTGRFRRAPRVGRMAKRRRFGWHWVFILAGAVSLSVFSPWPAGEGPRRPVSDGRTESSPLRLIRVPVADVRAGPHPEAELVTQTLYGTEVRVVGRRGDWLRVAIPTQGDYSGYVREAELTDPGPAFLVGPQAWVVAPRAPVRPGPDDGFPATLWVFMNTRLPLDGMKGQWLRIRLPGGGIGWLPGEAARVIRPGTSLAPSAKGVISAAERVRGAPYLWGGMTAEGIDCSALTFIAFGLQGIVLPRDADLQQVRAPGFPVERSQLRAGDLVFFSGNRQYATHVGIYRGDGIFIHAAPRTGGVAVSPLSELYWDRLYFGARRVLP